MLTEPKYTQEVATKLQLKESQVQSVLEMIESGDTVPFIARYRKEKTQGLDENNIRDIIREKDSFEKIFKAKQTAINGIEEMGKMTPELMNNILTASTLKEVEEIYKPYKSKKKTKAMLAIEKGFQLSADLIKENVELTENNSALSVFLQDYSLEEIIEGSLHIISAEVSASTELRKRLKMTLEQEGTIKSKLKTEKALEKLNEKDTKQIPKFAIYKDFEIHFSRIKPYQILALNRGENLGILQVKIPKTEETKEAVGRKYAQILDIRESFIESLKNAFSEGFTALFKSVENELRGILNEQGEDDAISSFQKNLEALLMTKPEYGKNILAIDPGYKAGCKIAILNEIWQPQLFNKIFLHAKSRAIEILKDLIKKHKVETVTIWNGTGCDETIEIVQEIFSGDIFIVNESGASVYSASKVAQEEFPDLDSLYRGTVSIGRRYIDPLSELVKVPVGSIGVGMYQHDMPTKKLEEQLWYIVEDVVNTVGINVNTASSYVLNHISGIDKRTAKKIYNHRPYRSRTELKKQLSDKAYEQAVGFLRVPESTEPLDNTDIHPEQYALAHYIIEQDINVQNYTSYAIECKNLYPEANEETVRFILSAYRNIGQDPREHSAHKKASQKVTPEDIKEGDILTGVVRNVVAFGAFVDIGLKNDGLVHISQLADAYVSDPSDFVELGQTVRVKLVKIDEKTGKIQLSMKGVS